MYLRLPVRSDLPNYDFQLELEGVLYTFDFRYNQREDRWTMDISDTDGTLLIGGVKIVCGLPLLICHQAQLNLPPGDFFAVDTAGADLSPGLTDLGSRVLLLYRESTTDDDAIQAGS